MAATDEALQVLQYSQVPAPIAILYFLIAGVVEGLLGCYPAQVFFALLAVYGVYHAVEYSLLQGVLIWLVSLPEIPLVQLACNPQPFELAMITTQTEFLKHLKDTLG